MLLSTSKCGLQGCIGKLASYSADNCLIANLKKTKSVVICKSGKLSKELFILMAQKIQNSPSGMRESINFRQGGGGGRSRSV